MFKNKLKASLIHLVLSILLVGLVIGSVLLIFFPKYFVQVSGFTEVAKIIISVDIILGPILTFVVFQPKKQSLKFDLSVIAAIQLTALIYGAYALYQVHPVYITFNVDRFSLISARDASPEKSKYSEYKVSKLSSGTLAFAKMPDDLKKREELLFESASGGRDLDQRAEYYEPYEKHINNIVSKGIKKEYIYAAADSDKEIFNFLENHENELKSFVFLPLTSAKKDAIIVLDKQTAQPIATINTDPWVLSQK